MSLPLESLKSPMFFLTFEMELPVMYKRVKWISEVSIPMIPAGPRIKKRIIMDKTSKGGILSMYITNTLKSNTSNSDEIAFIALLVLLLLKIDFESLSKIS